MSHYDEVLKEARSKASNSAKEYIPRLFNILVDEEKRSPVEARAIIEHDLISYWAKATMTKYLPEEAKDEIKVKAGKQGAKATNLILADGQTVTTKSDVISDVSPEGNDDDEEPTPLELAQIEIQQLKDVIKKTEQFKPANKLTEEQARDMTMEVVKQAGLAVPETNIESVCEWLKKRDDGVNCYWYDGYGIELFKTRVLTQLKGKGVTTFKRLYFEV